MPPNPDVECVRYAQMRFLLFRRPRSSNLTGITEFERNILGRLIHTLARDGGDKVQETVYQYNLDDNLIRTANRQIIICFDYDANG